MTLIVGCFVAVLTAAIGLSWVTSRRGGPPSTPGVPEFLLGSRSLNRSSVVNLLLSSSFGINAVFYAAWLGYQIGAWALLIQATWALSFYLLVPYSKKFASVSSLHDFMGAKFGTSTKVFAAVCSLVGIMYLVGWEVGIGKAAITSFLGNMEGVTLGSAERVATWITVGIVFGTVLYTTIGGIRGNAVTDKLLNLLKIVVVTILVVLLVDAVYAQGGKHFVATYFPPFSVVVANLGIWGLVTNILFNISWQFVDNSSWQSIVAGSGEHQDATASNLRYSGLAVFLTIGFLGTVLGASLLGDPAITPDNVLSAAVDRASDSTALVLAMMLVVAASMMSLVDGMLLAAALTVVVDLLPSTARDRQISPDARLAIARTTVVVAAVLSVWGIGLVFNILGVTLFDFVYIVILTQLALLGPVVVGLLGISNAQSRAPMWLAILLALAAGFGSAVYGTMSGRQFLVDGAGTIAILVSITAALTISVFPAPDVPRTISARRSV